MKTCYNFNCPNCNALISGVYFGKSITFVRNCDNCRAFLNIVIEPNGFRAILVEKPQVGYTPEPMPTEGRQVVLDEVIKDLKKRSEFGEKKYGTKLMTFNGRKPLVDLYQELCDALVYLKQELMERETKEKFIIQSYCLINNKGEVVALKIPKVKFYPIGEQEDEKVTRVAFDAYIEIKDERVIKYLKDKVRFEEEE